LRPIFKDVRASSLKGENPAVGSYLCHLCLLNRLLPNSVRLSKIYFTISFPRCVLFMVKRTNINPFYYKRSILTFWSNTSSSFIRLLRTGFTHCFNVKRSSMTCFGRGLNPVCKSIQRALALVNLGASSSILGKRKLLPRVLSITRLKAVILTSMARYLEKPLRFWQFQSSVEERESSLSLAFLLNIIQMSKS
jgi:hypothetical protein